MDKAYVLSLGEGEWTVRDTSSRTTGWLCPSPAGRPWATSVSSPFGFLVCKMKVTLLPTSQACYEE